MMTCTSYSHAPSSSVSPPSPTIWDVFLSFRGKDTRYTFTDHLYNGLQRVDIRTFMDNPDLRSGERISDALVKAIHESKTYVVVLSKNYASSRWCLDELVEILNCRKTMDRLVIPVFYNIEPAVVRHQIQEFAKAFEKHGARFEMERLAKWRVTLAELGEISGYPVGKDVSEASVVNEIVGRILFLTSPETLPIAKHPVGLDSRVEKITSMFSTSTKLGLCTRIGIHGMGGVGKTTLAKAVYNQNYTTFQGRCFLKNVREESATEKGLMRLQKQLIHNVLKRKDIDVNSVDHGIELIKSKICSTKLLLVIDDLDDPRKLDYLVGPFSLGSIIIITTRNEDLLDSIHVEARYKVNELDDAEARQLFTSHAFRGNQIPHALNGLSQEVIQRAGGLPLALEVFGLMLTDKDEEGWKCIMDRIKRASINDVKKTLMISFDGLQLDYQQHIFLDIACLFIGREETEVIKILETYYTSVVYNVDVLKKRSLLTINRRDNLMAMHHQLRDMGRDIARNNSPREPEKHSRLWVSEDICNVLKKKKGTVAIEGIIPAIESVQPAIEAMSLVTETFTKMSRLRFLYLENVTLTGNFEHILEDLRWLYWCRCPLKCFPPTFYPQRLLVLELPHSKLRTTWEQNVVMPVFRNLKTLNLSYSLDLTTIPDFTKLPTLETLNLEGCKNLEEVHVSIGSLTSLVSLNLCGCLKLTTLPHSICNLRALEVLSIANCRGLKAFPKELGNIESLKLVTRLRDLVAGNITDFSSRTEIRGLKELTSVRRLHVGGCNSSLLANTLLRERFFKVYSGFGRQINFYIGQAEFPVWIDQSNNFGSSVSLDLGSHNFWAMMICFKRRGNILHYSVENTTSESIWRDSFGNSDDESLIVIVPESIFSLRDGDNTIKLSANGEIHGYHLFSKTEIKMIDEDVSTTVNDVVELMNADRGSVSHLLEDREEVGCWSCLGGDFWRRWKPFGLVMTCDGEEEANVNLSGANGL